MCNLENFHWKMAPYECIIIALVLWDFIWKAIAMWRAARNNHPIWFICIAVFNTLGLLPIIYLILDKKKQFIKEN